MESTVGTRTRHFYTVLTFACDVQFSAVPAVLSAQCCVAYTHMEGSSVTLGVALQARATLGPRKANLKCPAYHLGCYLVALFLLQISSPGSETIGMLPDCILVWPCLSSAAMQGPAQLIPVLHLSDTA
jgi:hypothetical protein